MGLVRVYILIALIAFFSCKKEEDKLNVNYTLDPFHTIYLNDSFTIELVEQEEYGIEISGDESFVEKTIFSIQDCTLSIRNDKKLKWTDPANNIVKIRLKGKGIKEIHANESCDIRSLNAITSREFGIILKSKSNTANIIVDNKKCYYWNNFPTGGKLSLSGKTDELILWNFAIMSVDASALNSKYAYVENHSKGNCTVNVSDSLEYMIEGEGNIILFGNANVHEKAVNGSGSFVRK